MVDTLISDLTAQLEVASEALRRSEELATAGKLALELMHEIKNPLEALGHLTYLACEEADDAARVRKYMQLAEEQMATLTLLVNETLGLTRSLRPRSVEMTALAEAAVRIHLRTIEEKKIHLVKDLPRGMMAEVYTGQILQVLSNLIMNALDAMPVEGTLRLRLRRGKNRIRVLIVDNGHGIPTHHSETVFQPFFTTKKGTGTGLGLSLSKKIIERHGGTIAMRSSVRPGRCGTAFRLSLPA